MRPDADAADSALLRQERLVQVTQQLQQLAAHVAEATVNLGQATQHYQQLQPGGNRRQPATRRL
ncbi:hypothetical protein [Alishewanella longhuensis]